jgi:hypothetical protein
MVSSARCQIKGPAMHSLLAEWLVYTAGAILARVLRWSPLETDVVLHVESSRDAVLQGRHLRGTVIACDAYDLLIHLRASIRPGDCIKGEHSIDIVLVTPASMWARPGTLLVTSVPVAIIDAPSFVDKSEARVIGTGRLVKYTRR